MDLFANKSNIKEKKTGVPFLFFKRFVLMKWENKMLFFILSLLTFPLFGQVPDSLTIESVPVEIDTIQGASQFLDSDTLSSKKHGFIRRIFKEDYPNPKKALFLSLAIPGGGQIYNKRWWKLPFVYGGYTLLILSADFNTKNYRAFRDAYIAELAGEEHAYSNTGLDAGDLRRIRDGYDKNKQLSYIGLFALHLIQTAEAFVDSHLRTFDVSDDLSLRVAPKLGIMGDGSSYLGVGFTFQLSD